MRMHGINRTVTLAAAGCVGALVLSGTAVAADAQPAKHPKPHHSTKHHSKKHEKMAPMPDMPGTGQGPPTPNPPTKPGSKPDPGMHSMPGMNGAPGSGHYHCTVRRQAPADPAATNGASPYNPGSLQSHAKHTLNIVDAMNHCHVHEIPYAVYTPLQQAVHSPSQTPNAGPQAVQQEGVVLGQTSGEANATLQPLVTAQTAELARLTGH